MVLYLVQFLSRCSAKKFAHHSISTGYFCKDQLKFAWFGTFGSKWACLIMKTLENVTFIHTDSPYTVLYIRELIHIQMWLFMMGQLPAHEIMCIFYKFGNSLQHCLWNKETVLWIIRKKILVRNKTDTQAFIYCTVKIIFLLFTKSQYYQYLFTANMQELLRIVKPMRSRFFAKSTRSLRNE